MLTETPISSDTMKPADLGILLACVHARVSPADFPTHVGFVEGMRKSAGASQMGREVARFASELFTSVGRAGSFEAHLYGEMAKTANWERVHFDLLRPVYHALANVGGMEKSANNWLDSALKYIVGGGLLTGVSLGTLNWALNRDANADDAKSKSIMARTDLYNRMADEIAQELRANAPQDVQKALRRRNTEATV